MAALLLLILALSGGVAYAANAAVTIRGATFMPAAVTINAGESVTWTNLDGIPHSAKADDNAFDTAVFSTGSRTVTIARPGTYGYFCAVHPTTMRGTVNVLGPATPRPTAPPPPPPAATAPPTVVPTQRPVTAAPTVAPTATATASASPSPDPTPSPTPALASPAQSVIARASASPAAASGPPPPTSRSGDGPSWPIVIAAVLGLGALAGAALYLLRRP